MRNWAGKGLCCAAMLISAVIASASGVVYKEIKGQKEFTGTMIVRPKQNINSASKLRAKKLVAPYRLRYYVETDEYILRVPTGKTETTLANELLKSGLFQYAQPNWRLYPARTPNDPIFPQQWHHEAIRTPEAWGLHTGETIICAVTDTGVDIDHPDLRDLVVPGYNSAEDRAQSDGGDVRDQNGHGTHVAGCAAAHGNNGIGVAGVGWNFRLMPIKVTMGGGGGTTSEWLARGARWAVDNGAKVISASYSGVDDPNIDVTGAYVRSRGGIYMYAAGNDNRNLSGFDHQNTIVVGATAPGDQKAGFSAYGRAVDIFAPGDGIWSTTPGGNYGPASGTSMAAPVANGVACLIWSSNPSLTADQVEEILFETCKDLGDPGNDDYWGWGQVDAFEGVERAILVEMPEKSLPYAAVVFQGIHTAGGLPDLFQRDGDMMMAQTSFAPAVGDVAGIETRFALGREAYELRRIEIGLTAQSTTSASTGMLWAYNWNTRRYDHLKSFPLRTSAGDPIIVEIGEQRLESYISSSGQVRLAVRGHVPARRRVGAFTVAVDQIDVTAYIRG